MIDMHNQLRVCTDLMRSDLEQVITQPRPWSLESSPNGHLELVEGPRTDSTDYGTLEAVRGDFDDILSLTIRSSGNPFRGRWVDATGATQVLESNVAEVLWYTDFTDRNGNGLIDHDELITVYRRLLLVRPDLGLNLNVAGGTPVTPVSFFLQNDISMSFASGAAVANSTEDLAKRENRFAHNVVGGIPGAFPYAIDRLFLRNTQLNAANLGALNPANPSLLQYAGPDIVVRDVAAFDLMVFSPDAPMMQVNAGDLTDPNNQPDPVATSNSDPGSMIPPAIALTAVGSGAFVDLAWLARRPANVLANEYLYTGSTQYLLNSPQFSTWPNSRSGLQYFHNPLNPLLGFDVAYDTYSTHYESNGLDDDGDGIVDQGTNGLDEPGRTGQDDDSVNGVDDVGEYLGVDDVLERESEPPYPFELRGVKIVFRMIHRESAQAHQTSVVQSYVKK